MWCKTAFVDNWAVSPAVDLSAYSEGDAIELSLYAKGKSNSYVEYFQIWAGTSADPDEMTCISGAEDLVPQYDYSRYTADLSAFAGEATVYVAIRHCDAYDQFRLFVDAVEIRGPKTAEDETSVTVGDGTDTNTYVPVYSTYGYGKSQILVPASDLNALAGKNITSISFYATGESKTRNVAMYLTETSSEHVLDTEFVDASSATAVYSGDVEFTIDGATRIAFDAPYAYAGGNLLLTVLDNTGNSSPGLQFYGVEYDPYVVQCCPSRAAHGSNDRSYRLNPSEDPGGGQWVSFLPKMTFTAPIASYDLYVAGTQVTDVDAEAIEALAKIVLAVLVWLIGKWIIGKLLKLMENLEAFKRQEETLQKFLLNGAKIVLYVILIVSIIGILGVPMASIIAVLASAGLAVGMAMQGSLSNFAGGVMLMIFRPFKIGDYIEAAGGEGFVKEISLFYTVLNTTDNKTITIPNGSLMNANVTNMSAEELRRVDLTFGCAKGEDIAKVQEAMLEVMRGHELVLDEPAPFARLSGGTNEAMEFTTRAWCKSADYWTVYFDLTEGITAALGRAGVHAPAVRVVNE